MTEETGYAVIRAKDRSARAIFRRKSNAMLHASRLNGKLPRVKPYVDDHWQVVEWNIPKGIFRWE